MKKTNIKHLDLDIFYEKLDNGLEVYMIPKNNYNNIYATFSTKYGSNKIEFVPIDDNKMIKTNLGIAHFLEHKLFEQKDGVDPFTFFNERGADANANTNQKKTTYLFSGSSFFEENLNYLLDYVQDPYFTDKNVEKEKGIIEQEIKMYQDDSDTVLYESLLNNCFNLHPMKYPIIGTIESINAITKEELYKSYNTFYHPNNMFLVITGNINVDETIKLIKENQSKKQFKKFNNIKLKKYNEPDTVSVKEDSIKLNVSIPKASIAYKIKTNKNLYKQLLYILTLFDAKFGSTSDFVLNLTDEEIINSDLSIDFDNIESHIIVMITGETNNPSILLNKIKKEMKNLNISKEEFERKKKTLVSSLIYLSDNIFGLNHSVMNDIIRYNEFNPNKYDDIKNLNYEEFNEFIKNTNFDNYTTFIVNPK